MAAKTYAEWIKSDDKTIPLSMSLAEAAWNAATEAAEEKFTSTNRPMVQCKRIGCNKQWPDTYLYCPNCGCQVR